MNPATCALPCISIDVRVDRETVLPGRVWCAERPRALVAIVHGLGEHSGRYGALAAEFVKGRFTVVALDLPGHGETSGPRGDMPSWEKVRDQVVPAMFTATRGLPDQPMELPVVLLGHSMGGMVAQEVVARRPDLVSRLILCGTSAAFGKPDGDWQREFIAQRTAPLDAGHTMAELAEVLVPQMIGPGSLPEGVKLATHCMAMVPPATYRRALEALVTFDRRSNLSHIDVPTLLIAGDEDEGCLEPNLMLKRTIPTAGLALLPKTGHTCNLEEPELFTRLLERFFADVENGAWGPRDPRSLATSTTGMDER